MHPSRGSNVRQASSIEKRKLNNQEKGKAPMAIAYTIVSTWKYPLCSTRRFASLPQPVFVLTNAYAALPSYARYAPLANNLSRYDGMHARTASHSTKEFVQWLANSPFKGAWHIEDDVVSKNWRKLLTYNLSNVDILGMSLTNGTSARFYSRYCSICTFPSKTLLAWPLVYISKRFAQYLLKLILEKQTGHHEVFSYAACLHLNCKHVQVMHYGIQLVSKYRRARRLDINAYDFVHPHKCKSRM